MDKSSLISDGELSPWLAPSPSASPSGMARGSPEGSTPALGLKQGVVGDGPLSPTWPWMHRIHSWPRAPPCPRPHASVCPLCPAARAGPLTGEVASCFPSEAWDVHFPSLHCRPPWIWEKVRAELHGGSTRAWLCGEGRHGGSTVLPHAPCWGRGSLREVTRLLVGSIWPGSVTRSPCLGPALG